ncbi:MAG: hypothetical protein J6I49_09160 [Bacteroidales bacterium]|nr:hypothetical protein [Bacteroidales bacterium]
MKFFENSFEMAGFQWCKGGGLNFPTAGSAAGRLEDACQTRRGVGEGKKRVSPNRWKSVAWNSAKKAVFSDFLRFFDEKRGCGYMAECLWVA